MKEITFIAAFWVSLAIVACIGRMIIKKKSNTMKDGTSITDMDEPESSTGCDDKEISENNKLMVDQTKIYDSEPELVRKDQVDSYESKESYEDLFDEELIDAELLDQGALDDFGIIDKKQ